MIRVAIALVLVAHGIGHSMGIVQVLKVVRVNPRWDGRSWLLSDAAGPTITDAVGLALWSVALVGFVMVGAVVMGWLPEGLFVPLAVASSAASMVAVAWYHWTPGDLAA